MWLLVIKYIFVAIFEELYKITHSCLLSWQQPASILLGILNSNLSTLQATTMPAQKHSSKEEQYKQVDGC